MQLVDQGLHCLTGAAGAAVSDVVTTALTKEAGRKLLQGQCRTRSSLGTEQCSSGD